MHRELGDERRRYGRKSLRERLDDALAWPGSHRAATGVIVVIVIGAALLYVATARPVDRRDLAIGDCLYVPTDAAKDPTTTRPIGEPGAVEDVIIRQGAEEAGCTASHGHEVSAIVTATVPTAGPAGSSESLDRDAIRRITRPLCEAAFAGYVGHALAGSAFTTFPLAPEPAAWLAEGGRTVCLVARVDGGWMDQPARGSGE
jgi:hypothetical protein